MKNKAWLKNNLLFMEARKSERADDIAYARVYSVNFPVDKKSPSGSYKAFFSSEEAAVELIKKGKTESKNVRTVARNIFAAAMACEGREDRKTDRRWSAYKNDAEETILWDFVDVSELSPENQEIYKEEHGKAAPTEEEDTEIIKKAKNILIDDRWYVRYKAVKAELKFNSLDTYSLFVAFANKEIEIPKDIEAALKVLKFQKEKFPEDKARKAAYAYAAAIRLLQKEGKLPRKQK